MIQLRSAIEELGRVQRRPEVVLPTWQRDEEVREVLDGALREDLVSWGADPGRKALIIGGSWPRLAADLAGKEMFVTVVEPDPERARQVSECVGAVGLLNRVTVTTDDYKARNFEASGFNLIVAWDTLGTYTEQAPLLKKAVRELKAGGKLFVRAAIEAPGDQGRWLSRLRDLGPGARRLIRIALSLSPRVRPDVVAQDTFLMPGAFTLDRAALREAVDKVLVVQSEQPHHVLAPDLADVVAHVNPGLGRLLPAVVALDQRIVSRRPELARFVAIKATHERELGKVFRR